MDELQAISNRDFSKAVSLIKALQQTQYPKQFETLQNSVTRFCKQFEDVQHCWHLIKTTKPLSAMLTRVPKNGDYLLSHLRSTIGVVGLNFSVRNGKRWDPDAIVT